MTQPPATLPDVLHQLLNPRVDLLQRDPDDLAREQADHDRRMTELRNQHAALLRRPHRQGAQATRVLARMLDLQRRWDAAADARATARGEQPSLLDQLAEAVTSSTGCGYPTAGRTRSPIGLAAAELLGDIERTIAPTTGHGPRTELARRVWAWANRWATATDTLTAASRWVTEARAILEPERPLDLVAACPHCRTRTVHVDDAGEQVRRPALQVDRVTGEARCIRPGCGATWPASHLHHLASVLEQQVAEDRAQRELEGAA